MNDRLPSVLEEAARLAAETADAFKRGDADAAAKLQREADAAWQRARRLASRHTTRPMLSKAPSMRERAIAAVAELNVPCSPRLIAAYAEARTGEPFDVRAIASIRRDEYRSWKTSGGSRRHTYLVPALEGPWLLAGRGRFALSYWPLWQRIVGPLSPRADHLKICLCLVEQVESADRKSDLAGRMRTLLADYARTVPGALSDAWESGPSLDTSRVREAVAAELSLIKSEDEGWRMREAERATRTLNAEQQLWGGVMPQVVARVS